MKSKDNRLKKGLSIHNKKLGKFSIIAGFAITALIAIGLIISNGNRERTTDATTPPSWSALGTGGNANINSIAFAPNGDLYVVGNSTITGGVATNNRVARWDGTNWSAVGGTSSINATPNVIAFAPNGDLYLGGIFTSVNGIPGMNRISRWNGTNWNFLSGGVGPSSGGVDWNTGVSSLAIAPNGDVYVGGSFTSVSGLWRSNISRWNGTVWNPVGPHPPSGMGPGLNNAVRALAVASNGDLYIGGNFIATADGVSANRIVRWDGTNWSALGMGTDGGVASLVFAPNGDLYVGGTFTIAGGVSANNIARWDGTNWSALGMGTNGMVADLAFAPNGDLYVSGLFTTVDGISANNIARWNGTTWSALGTGMNGVVVSLAFAPNGDLYAGGNFTTAGGVSANNIARWNGTRINTPPTITLSEPYNNPLLDGNTIIIGGTVSDPDDGQTLTLQYQFNGTSGAWNNLMTKSTPANDTAFLDDADISGLDDGNHTVFVRVCDDGDPVECSDPVSASFAIDRTPPNSPPTITISAPHDNPLLDGGIMSVSGTVSDPDAGQILTVQYQFDGSVGIWNELMMVYYSPFDGELFIGDVDISALDDGDHVIFVRVCDNDNPVECSDALSADFAIDRTVDTSDGEDGDGGDIENGSGETDTNDSDDNAGVGVPNTGVFGGLVEKHGAGAVVSISSFAVVVVVLGVVFVGRKLIKVAQKF